MASTLEKQFASQLLAARLPEPEKEFLFSDDREWRFDFAWPSVLLAIEIHGGGWVEGKHHREAGMSKDARKHADAVLAGWTVVAFPGGMVKSGEAIRYTAKLIDQFFGE